jgi:hypothetical protein
MLAVVFVGCPDKGASLVDSNGQNKRIGVRGSVNNDQWYIIDESDFAGGTQLIDGIEKGELSKKEE